MPARTARASRVKCAVLMSSRGCRSVTGGAWTPWSITASPPACRPGPTRAWIPTKQNADRIGLLVGSGIGGLRTIETTSVAMNEKGARKVSPFFIPGLMINMVSGYLSIQLGLRGLNLATATACTTSTHAIGLALRAIQYGDADVILAGGAEHACTPTAMAGFSSARAMSTRNDDPTRASRPWDKGRDGFVLADGSAVLVLEEREHALARGAKIYAELSGFGMSGDAHHITAPPEDGDGAARAMAHALADAGLAADGIDYLNAHATSTPLGDRAEVNAIKRVFGEHAYKLAVSSTKSITGHMLGAAGVIEALFSVLALHHGVVPPTANLDEPDEGCDLDFVPHTAREMKVTRRCVQLVRLWWHQRHAGVPGRLSALSRACGLAASSWPECSRTPAG